MGCMRCVPRIFYLFLISFFLQFFHGTAPKPSLSQVHQAIFGFNDDQAQSETVRCLYSLDFPSKFPVYAFIWGLSVLSIA